MKMMKKAAAAVLACALAAGSLAGCGKTVVDGTKTLVTIDGEEVKLGVAAFLARYRQASMYSIVQYYGSNGFYNTVADTSTNKTYEELVKEGILEDIESLVVTKQHAADYDVTLTDEELAEIDEAAAGYDEKNSDEVKKAVGASKEDVKTLLTLYKYREKMLPAVVKDVDTKVTDDEAQQTTFTYVRISTTSYGADDESTASSAASSDASTEASGADAEQTEAQKAALADAEKILKEIKASKKTADADISAIATEVTENAYVAEGSITRNDPEEDTYNSSLVDAVLELSDGEVCDKVIEAEGGSMYYIVRVEKVFDEEATEEAKENIVIERKEELFDETVDEWLEAAEIKVDEAVFATLRLKDDEAFSAAAAVESDVSEVVSGAASSDSGAYSAASEASESSASSDAESSEASEA